METTQKREAWNKGKLVGQKTPLKPKDIWAIRIYLQNANAVRDLAMFNLAIDSKLRGCDLVGLRVRDVTHGNQIVSRAMVTQRKTQRPVQFELTEPTRSAVASWVEKAQLRGDQHLFPSRVASSPHVSTRQYARIVHCWVREAGLDSSAYGTHSMRRTKATLIYKRTKNLRAVQLLLGHMKLESTVCYLGIEVDEGDSPLAAEDHVVRTQVPVTDGPLIAAKRGCRGRVVEVPDQCRGAADSSVGEPVGGDARHLTVDEGQNLASVVVVAERTGSAVEADIGQVLQERVNVARSMVSRPAGGASHPDEPFGLHPAHKHVLDRLFHPTTIARPAASEQHPHIKLRRHAELPDRRHVG